jgi:hypothetical protein
MTKLIHMFWVRGTCSKTDTSSLTRRFGALFCTCAILSHRSAVANTTEGEITSAGFSASSELVTALSFRPSGNVSQLCAPEFPLCVRTSVLRVSAPCLAGARVPDHALQRCYFFT